MQTECLVEIRGARFATDGGRETVTNRARLCVTVRFLQPMTSEVGVLAGPGSNWNGPEPRFRVVPELRAGDKLVQTRLEAMERRIDAPPLELDPGATKSLTVPFRFPAERTLEPVYEGEKAAGVIMRRHEMTEGKIELKAQPLSAQLFKVSSRLTNLTPLIEEGVAGQDALLMRSFVATHTVLNVKNGGFISLAHPSDAYKHAAGECANIGTWPVLVGDEERRECDTMLSSPIILNDYPKLAAENTGPPAGGSQGDKILTLRIQTKAEPEKVELRQVA